MKHGETHMFVLICIIEYAGECEWARILPFPAQNASATSLCFGNRGRCVY